MPYDIASSRVEVQNALQIYIATVTPYRASTGGEHLFIQRRAFRSNFITDSTSPE